MYYMCYPITLNSLNLDSLRETVTLTLTLSLVNGKGNGNEILHVAPAGKDKLHSSRHGKVCTDNTQQSTDIRQLTTNNNNSHEPHRE